MGILKVHSQKHNFHRLSKPFSIHPLRFLFNSSLFSLLSSKLRAAPKSKKKRKRKKEFGLTPLIKVIEERLEQQATIIYSFYLFICSDVIWCRGWKRGEKQYSFLLMRLPTIDNVPELFPFTWVFHATRCAWKAKCYSYSSKPDSHRSWTFRQKLAH